MFSVQTVVISKSNTRFSVSLQLAMSKRNCPDYSPTQEVLREWQRGLTVDQDVPVHILNATLEALGRPDVTSEVDKMMKGTELKFEVQ